MNRVVRIYICIPETLRDHQDDIRSGLCSVLKEYYGSIDGQSVEFFDAASGKIEVYVMDEAVTGSDEDIMYAITSVFDGLSPDDTLNVRLNYQRFNPDFRPSPQTQKPVPKGKDGLSLNYYGEEPHYNFDQVVLPQRTRDAIERAAAIVNVEEKVFDEWGLRNIVPYAASAMNFYGPPGTGKTMAAEAAAGMLGKKIIRASYADIESKYHGEGPKMLKALFMAAEREDAVLFIDEADLLLSRRLTDISSGSEHAINAMRGQLLICLEHFKGIVIFATNFIESYDDAFFSRLIGVEFFAPDMEARRAIWERHMRGKGLRIPLSEDVNIDELTEKYDTFCGRDIKNSVQGACVIAAMQKRETVTQSDFLKASEQVKKEREKRTAKNKGDFLKEILQKKIDEENAQKETPSP